MAGPCYNQLVTETDPGRVSGADADRHGSVGFNIWTARIRGKKSRCRAGGLGLYPGFRATDTTDNRQDQDQKGSCIAIVILCANQHKQTVSAAKPRVGCRCEAMKGSGDDRGVHGTLLTLTPPITTVGSKPSYDPSRK